MKPIADKPTGKVIQDADRTGISPGFDHPDPEVSETKHRRKFTAKYKLKILAEAGSCSLPGQVGALLRREGLYSSHISTWRKLRDQGFLHAMTPQKRGRKIKEKNPLAGKIAQVERENERLKKKLAQAAIIIDVQKKLSEILGIHLPSQSEEKE